MTEFDAETTGGLKWLVRAYASRRYAILFYSLLITIAAGPLFEALGVDAGLLEVLLAANLLAAVLPVGPGAVRRFLLCALLAVCSMRLGAAWLDNPMVTVISLAMWTVVALIAAAGAIRFAMRARTVDREHLYAALDAYLLFGIFQGVLYWALDRAWPASIVVTGQQTEVLLSLSASIYFSFVTLVTLGYGDILPHSDAARGLAIVEAVTGQFFLAVMIAHLVSLHVRGGNQSE